MPQISVILPCYNVEKVINRCLRSIVAQTFGINNIEIICVDDCSTDNTLEVLRKWEKQYQEQIIVVKSPINGRQGQARNIGLQHASADWIAFIDSDDWIDPEYLEWMYQYTHENNIEIICCGYKRDFSSELVLFDEEYTNNYRLIEVNSEDDRKRQIMHPELNYNAWAKLFRKDFLIDNELMFPANITYEDAQWGSLVHLYFKKACILERKLYHYYVNNDSTVLKTNSNHHLDCLTSETQLWNEYKRRGLLEKYREELEVEHIYSAYLPGIKMLIYRYDTPDYNIYLLLRELILERIPDIKGNKYYKNGEFKEFYLLIIEALVNQLNKSQFLKFAENIKTVGI